MIGLMKLLNTISNKVENRAREFYWACGLVNYKYQDKYQKYWKMEKGVIILIHSFEGR